MCHDGVITGLIAHETASGPGIDEHTYNKYDLLHSWHIHNNYYYSSESQQITDYNSL